MKLNKLLSLGVTTVILTSSFTSAFAKDTLKGSRDYNRAHGVENVLDRNNYCNTSCIAHQETIHFGKDLDQTLQMDARKLSILQGMENKIRGLGKNTGFVACVSGHTDSDASHAYNRNLSQRRARTVGKRMRAVGLAKGVPIRARGYGETRPIATNATKLGMAQNRRVVVQYGYNKVAGAKCLVSGIGDRVARIPAAIGGLGTAGKVALGVLAAGAIAALVNSGDDGTTGTTN